ncbi:MAG: ABC transporter substrate-binding protein, partial [Proteobacteria bacterium]|nr:ABC transporter substrate-binding protein [Pseudomonadota bacterium]
MANAAVAEQVIAVVATKDSPYQPHGDSVVPGVVTVAERLNGAGGVLGQALRVVPWVEDCTRNRAGALAAEIAELKPRLVIGHLCAGAALAAAPIYARAGILAIVPGVRYPGLAAVQKNA